MTAEQAAPGWRWAPAWVLAFVALWPAPGYAEAVLALGAIAGIVRLLLSRFRGSASLLSGPAWALTSVLFFSYWLPEAISAVDAADRGRALREAFVDLVFVDVRGPLREEPRHALARRHRQRLTLLLRPSQLARERIRVHLLRLLDGCRRLPFFEILFGSQ